MLCADSLVTQRLTLSGGCVSMCIHACVFDSSNATPWHKTVSLPDPRCASFGDTGDPFLLQDACM